MRHLFIRRRYLIIIVLLGTLNSIKAQDTLFYKNGQQVICKILEIGDDKIKYRETSSPEGPDFSISTDRLKSIGLESGRRIEYKTNSLKRQPPDEKQLNKKNALKIAPFSPFFGNLVFGLEHVQKPGFNWEIEAGILGVSNRLLFNDVHYGFWIYTGPKLNLERSTIIPGEQYFHPLHGFYFRPEIGFEYQSGSKNLYIFNTGDEKVSYELFHYGTMLNFGYQWYVANSMTIDMWLGIGAAYNDLSFIDKSKYPAHKDWPSVRSRSVLSYAKEGGDVNIAFNSGFKIGFVF